MEILNSLARRGSNLFVAVDQLVYVLITLGMGNPDETCSSAAWRMECDGKFFGFFRGVIDTLFFWERDHCRLSYEKGMQRKDFINSRYLKR